jgi:hypothetical protein
MLFVLVSVKTPVLVFRSCIILNGSFLLKLIFYTAEQIEMATALAKKVKEFVKDTVRGHESGFYKSRLMIPFKLNTESIAGIIPGVTINYFNIVYDALVVGKDTYINEKFGAMQADMKHSPVCLINMIFMLTVQYHTKLDRTTFDLSSYEKYMESVIAEFEKKFPSVAELAPTFGHECDGSEKAPALDPGQKMFYLGKK